MDQKKERRRTKRVMVFGLILLILLLGPIYILAKGELDLSLHWQTAPHDPTGLAPDPVQVKEAVVQVYVARSFSWRGAFGVHSWIAIKPKDAEQYMRYEKIGWNLYRSIPPVTVHSHYAADAQWYGANPWLLSEFRGEEAERIIAKMPAAVDSYPFHDSYAFWPGPNSNTFIAHIGREIPELRLDLPATAIGKDYLGLNLVAKSPSNTGYQLSVFGIFGILVGKEEGIELNILSLNVGIDPLDLAIRYPGIGTIKLKKDK